MQNSGSFGNLPGAYRVHDFEVTVNGVAFSRVVINTHYEKKHKAVISDRVILELVRLLDHKTFEVHEVNDGFKYFVNEDWMWNGKPYRLVWLIPADESYLGVVNAFRRPE